MTTLKDVALQAGVSITTVSIIINGKAKERKISEETVRKVYQAIEKLNYIPNITARALRGESAPTFTVGLYWASDFRSSFLARFMTGLQNWILQSSLPVHIIVSPYISKELYKEKNLYNLHSFNAAIIANASEADLQYIHEQVIPIPVVLNNRPSDIYSTVMVDNFELGVLAATHLHECNVKTAGIIALESEFYSMGRASQGFMKTCEQLGIAIDARHRLSVGPLIEDTAHAVSQAFDARDLPEGIFCDTDTSALGLIYTLNRQGVSIPKEVKIVAVGQGNPNFTRFSTPSITIVDTPLEQMAFKCLDMLAQQYLEKNFQPLHYQFPLSLTQRESTCK